MYVCMYVCTYVCMCVYIYIYIHTCVCIYIYICSLIVIIIMTIITIIAIIATVIITLFVYSLMLGRGPIRGARRRDVCRFRPPAESLNNNSNITNTSTKINDTIHNNSSNNNSSIRSAKIPRTKGGPRVPRPGILRADSSMRGLAARECQDALCGVRIVCSQCACGLPHFSPLPDGDKSSQCFTPESDPGIERPSLWSEAKPKQKLIASGLYAKRRFCRDSEGIGCDID